MGVGMIGDARDDRDDWGDADDRDDQDDWGDIVGRYGLIASEYDN